MGRPAGGRLVEHMPAEGRPAVEDMAAVLGSQAAVAGSQAVGTVDSLAAEDSRVVPVVVDS